MTYRLLADATMTLHFLFLVYVVLGGFLAWRWPKAWYPHAAICLYAVVITIYAFMCPLTPLENRWRAAAGQEGLEPAGFVGTYIEGVIYPEEYASEIKWASAVVVAFSWIMAYGLQRRRAQAAASTLSGSASGSGSNAAPGTKASEGAGGTGGSGSAT